jgi:hypothetical protein
MQLCNRILSSSGNNFLLITLLHVKPELHFKGLKILTYFSVLGLDQDLHRQQRGQAFSKPCDYGSSGGMVQ